MSVIFLKKKIKLLFLFSISSFTLFGCASSDVARDVSSNIDVGVQHTRRATDIAADGSIADSYQNASQRAKVAMIGGAAGALTGWVSPIGIFPGAVVGAILGASYGSYIDQNMSLEDQLKNRGATIVVIGDQILVMIPSARIFDVRSPRIKHDAYSTLNLVIRYINEYTKMLVKIAAYTDCVGSRDANLSLSQEQAENVARYLVAGGIDARILYAAGYGGAHLVQRTSYAWDGSDNYRIEITLEKLYV